MLIPQFSLRWLLGASTAVVVVCALVAWGMTGQLWALAISLGLAALAILMLVYASLFAVIWALAAVFSRRASRGQSPFQSAAREDGLAAMLLAVGLAMASPASVCGGESGTTHQGTGAGLAVTVDTTWLDGSGYRPVRIMLRPIAPVTADRTLTVEMLIATPPETRSDQYGLRVVRHIEIPAGSGPVEATLEIPQSLCWNSYKIHFVEDGQLIRPLSFTHAPNTGYAWQATEEGFPRILFVGQTSPDTSALASSWPVEEYRQYGYLGPGDTSGTGAPQPGDTSGTGAPQAFWLPSVMVRPADRLPRHWREYTNLDVVCLRVDDLVALKTRPDAFLALRRWVAAGGNLWVYGVGSGWQRLKEVESLLDLATEPRHGSAASRGWSLPDRGLYQEGLRGLGDYYTSGLPGGMRMTVGPDGRPVEVTESPPPPVPDEAPFVFRSLGMGQVVALADRDPFPGDQYLWRWLLNSTGSTRWLWYQRHGLSMLDSNPDFWNFLIPGVGLAPVNAFLVLISLFVVAIGPINYLLLRRWRRLHLLLVTTPASAALVTASLFGYAFFADGLSTRLRVRSVTHVDQRRGEAVCWSRLSYYSGLAPSDGLRFPDDVAVIPLAFLPIEMQNAERTLVWQDGQWLSRGWIASRRPTQFLTVRSRASRHRLELAAAPDASGACEFTNHLATRIEQVVIRGKDGAYYRAKDVAPGARVKAPPVKPDIAARDLQQVFLANQPQFLPGADRQSMTNAANTSWMRNRFFWYFSRVQLPDPAVNTSRLEASLGQPFFSDSSEDLRLRPGSYLAVVEKSPEVATGAPAARLQAGFHVILGTW